VLFIIFAIAAIAFGLCAFRWGISIRGRGRRAALLTSSVAGVAALASLVADVRAVPAASEATASPLAIRIVRRGDWWQLRYDRDGLSFMTANEMHVPADRVVALEWTDAPPPWIDGSLCQSAGDHRCALFTGAPRRGDALFVAAHPLVRQRLHFAVDPPAQFDAWFRVQSQPAHAAGDGPALFASAGCAYCHVIRGVTTDVSQIAPDLTHFASRATIAGTPYPITRAFLSGWIANSRGLKPHSAMPRNAIAPATLQRLTDYVRSLR